MKRLLLLILVVLMVCSGCCYAPGNERAPFIEKWMELPSLPMDDYQSTKLYAGNTGETVEPSDPASGIAIQAPEVDLESMPARKDSDFVRVKDYIPDVVVDLEYATANNFTGAPVYDFTDVYLRYGTVVKLMEVQDALRQKGLLLKIWDGFRPLEAQKALWEAFPDSNYVSNPATGSNSHSRGNTLDVTLVDASGNELEMPTGFDDFTEFVDRDYSDCTDTAASNAQLLEDIMEEHGFAGYQAEWWHFTDTADYEIEECFDPGEIAQYYADCREYINLRTAPSVTAGTCGQIRANEKFMVLGWDSGMAYVEFNGQRGYVNADYIARVGG